MPEQEKTPRMVVYCKGGLIQWILTETDIDVLHIDADVQDTPESDDRVMSLVDVDGDQFYAEAGIYGIGIEPEKVEHYFRQIEITEQMAQRYIQSSDEMCLYCDNDGSWEISDSTVQVDGNTAYMDRHCHKCGRSWRDCFKLEAVISND